MGANLNFTTVKDRIWAVYDLGAAWLARRPMRVRRAGYGVFGLILRIAYLLPRSPVRATFTALAQQTGAHDTGRLFADWVRGFCLGMNRIEQVRHGRPEEVDAMFRVNDPGRLEQLATTGGVIVVPHTHASLAMGRGLARRHHVLALVRSTKNEKRAASENEIFRSLDCDYLDVRTEKPSSVARNVLATLNEGRIVMATVDRLRTAPPAETPVDNKRDTLRVTAFGQPVGAIGWPARFANKVGVPIVPATVLQTDDTITLHLGEQITPSPDLRDTTQRWIAEMERLIRAHPEEWTFVLDRYWSKTLRAAAAA